MSVGSGSETPNPPQLGIGTATSPPVGSETPKRWWLQVLGGFRLTNGTGQEIALPGRTDPALLTYLALNQGRRHIRAQLAALLWAARADAPHSLSVSLNKLRNALGDAEGRIIVRESDPVATDFRAMTVDALTFAQLAAEDTREALERAEALFAGDLLEGLDLRSEDFEHWLAGERTRLRELLVDVLRRLLHLRAESGETERAIDTAQQVLRLDDISEEGYQQLIRLQARAGRRSGALRTAQICEETLKRDGIVPGAETRRVIDEIRRSYDPPGFTDSVSLATSPTEPKHPKQLLNGPPGHSETTAPDPSAPSEAQASLESTTLVPIQVPPVQEMPQGVPEASPTNANTVPSGLAGAPQPQQSEASPVETVATKVGEGSVPTPPAPQSWFRRHWLSITLASVLILALSPLSYYFWRYWSVPWLAPDPLDDIIIEVKALLPGAPQSRIAVLPFDNLNDNPSLEPLVGLSGEIGRALKAVTEMFVINAVATPPRANNPSVLREIAKDLGVRYLVIGSVQQFGEEVRVAVSLVDTDAGLELWGANFWRQAANMSGPQYWNEITLDVITEIQVQLTGSDQERLTVERLKEIRGTGSLPAYRAASEGLKLLRHLTPEDTERARGLYRKAIGLDQGYAGAHEGLAWTYLLDAEFGWTSSKIQSFARAQLLTRKALQLDPEKAQLYSLRGHLNLLQRNFQQAVDDGERAAETGRNDADAAALLAFTLTYTGKPERARRLLHKAIELSPSYPAWYGWALGRAYRLAGDPARAIETLVNNLPDRPTSIIPLVELVIAYSQAGKASMAKDTAAAIHDKVPNFSVSAWAAAQPYEDPAMTEHDAAALRAAGLPD